MRQLTIRIPENIVEKIIELIALFGGSVISKKIEVVDQLFDAETPALTGRQLRQLRMKMKLNQTEMGHKLGIGRSQLSQYETGYIGITSARSKQILEALEEPYLGVGPKLREQFPVEM